MKLDQPLSIGINTTDYLRNFNMKYVVICRDAFSNELSALALSASKEGAEIRVRHFKKKDSYNEIRGQHYIILKVGEVGQ